MKIFPTHRKYHDVRMLVFQMITGVDFCCLKCIFTEQLRLENKSKNRGMISHRTSDNLNNKV